MDSFEPHCKATLDPDTIKTLYKISWCRRR